MAQSQQLNENEATDFLNAQRQVNITFERILFLQHAQTIARYHVLYQ